MWSLVQYTRWATLLRSVLIDLGLLQLSMLSFSIPVRTHPYIPDRPNLTEHIEALYLFNTVFPTGEASFQAARGLARGPRSVLA